MRTNRAGEGSGTAVRAASTILLLATAGTVAGLVSCSDGGLSPGATPAPPLASATGTNCGVSYTLTTNETDSLMTQYDLPATQDTIAVCETWTGSDYSMRSTITGSSENSVSAPDPITTTTYENGLVQGMTSDGSVIATADDVGPTAFDFMLADASMVQASYDDPYYGVYSPTEGGSACVDPATCQTQLMSRPATGRQLAPLGSVVGAADDTLRYRKHGLRRRGVRALVDDMVEIARSREGYRRFRKVAGGDEVVLVVDPRTELLVGEEFKGKDGLVLRATHSWRRARGGFVKERTDVQDEEVVRGRTYRNRSTVEFHDVRVGGVSVAP